MRKLIAVLVFLVSTQYACAYDIKMCDDYVVSKVEKIYSQLDREDSSLDKASASVARLALSTILDPENDYICKEQDEMLKQVANVINITL